MVLFNIPYKAVPANAFESVNEILDVTINSFIYVRLIKMSVISNTDKVISITLKKNPLI